MSETPLLILVQYAAKRLGQTLEERFAAEGLKKLHPPEGQILGLLHQQPGLSASDIQAQLCISKSTVSAALSDLVDLGLIEYVVSEEDRREKRIIETEKGKQYQERAWGVIKQFRNDVLDGLDDKEQRALRLALEKIIENTEGGSHEQ